MHLDDFEKMKKDLNLSLDNVKKSVILELVKGEMLKKSPIALK